MKFLIEITNEIEKGEIIYNEEDYSFDFRPNKVIDCALLIGYLNLSLTSETRKLKMVWGMNPHTTWILKNFKIPKCENGSIYVSDNLIAGENIRLIEAGKWKTYYNSNNGWVCIGEHNVSEETKVIQFATNCMLSINNCSLEAIWLKPRIISNKVQL